MSATNDTCNLGEEFWRMTETAEYVTYGLLPIFVLALGMPGQLIAVVSFYIQSKKQKAYGYQIFSSVSDLLELVTIVSLVYIFNWSGLMGPGSVWFKRTHVLMWYAAHLVAPFLHMTVTNSLLASFCMSVDRVLALSMPMKYRHFKHRRNQIVAFVACIVIAITTSIFDCFRYYLREEDDGSYEVVLDLEYANGVTSRVFAHIRNGTRLVGILFLLSCDISMIYFYTQRDKNHMHMAGTHAEKEEKKKKQKILLLLTLSQSFLTSVRVLGQTALSIVIYGVPTYSQCGQLGIVLAIADAIAQITAVSDFYIWVAVSKQFRKNVFEALGPLFSRVYSFCSRGTQVSPIENTHSNRIVTIE